MDLSLSHLEKEEIDMLNNLDLMKDFRSSILKGGVQPRNTMRVDRRGLSIASNQKGYRISFKDSVTNDKA